MSYSSLVEKSGTWRPVLWLTGPVLAEETLTLLVTWTDWWLTGRYLAAGGDNIKAAMGLMAYTMWLIPSLFATAAIGATAIVARRFGAREFEQGRLVANQALLVGAALAGVVMTAGWLLGDQYISVMQLQGEAAAYARQYLSIVLPVIPLIMVEQVGAACLRGAGDTVTGFAAKSVVVVINIGVSLVLCRGLLGFEAMGWSGIALGTVAGHATGGTIILIALARGRAGLGLNRHHLAPRWSVIRNLVRIGSPGGVDIGLMLLGNLVFVSIINRLGPGAAAAHGLAIQLEACAYLPANGFHVAAATLTGQFLGAQRVDRALDSVRVCLILSLLVISATGCAIYLGCYPFVTFFTGMPDHPTTHNVVELLRLVVFAFPAISIITVYSGSLRGAGDTLWPMLITLGGFALIRIPLAIVMAYDHVMIPGTDWRVPGLGWGVKGAWTGMCIDLAIRAAVMTGWYRFGSWKNRSL